MWSGMYKSLEASRFEAAREAAAGMPYPGERGNYTAEFFLADFPQFTRAVPQGDGGQGKAESSSLVPEAMLELLPARPMTVSCRPGGEACGGMPRVCMWPIFRPCI